MSKRMYPMAKICAVALSFGACTVAMAQNQTERGTVIDVKKVTVPQRADENVVQYGYPENTYFRSYDTGDVLYTVPKGPIVIVSPPWMNIPFNDISTVSGEGQWFINTTEKGSDFLPTGPDTPLEGDADGNYIYPVMEARDDYYRYPILKYGDQTYKLSDKSWGSGVDVYTISGIQATSSRIGVSLMNIHYGNFYRDFADGFKFGGKTYGVVYPLGMCNMLSDQQSNIEFICDNNMETAFRKLGANTVGDRWLVDCGDTIPRGEIKIHFSDEEHILNGKGVISVGDNQFNLTPVAYYDANEMDGTVFTCNAGGIKARVIDFAVTEMYSSSNAYVTEIKEENMHVFSVAGKEMINYPAMLTDMGVYLDNEINNLLDDDPNTIYWNGGPQNANNYITVDCGESAARNNIKMVFCDGDKPDSGVLEISKDNEEWTELYSFTSADLTEENAYTIVVDAKGQEARYVRMKLTVASNYWLKMADFIVEGARQFSEEVKRDPTVDKLLTYYPKPADPFYLDMISMMSCTYDGANKILPNGQTLKLAILKVNEDKTLGDTIAKSSIIVSDIIRRPYVFSDGVSAIILDWRFYNEPEDGIGTPEQTSVLIDSPFAVMIYDIDRVIGISLSMQFGYQDTMSDLYGIAKYTYRGDDTEYDQGGFTYWWTLFGTYKTLRPDEKCKTMTVSLDGGEAGYTGGNGEWTTKGLFYSSSDMKGETVKVETPEWLTCTFGETVNGKSEFTVVAQKSSEVREGDIVITDGDISTTIKVKQNNTSGIENMENQEVKVIKDGNRIVVSYPDMYNRLSVYNANGMLIGNYVLDGNGAQVLDESVLNGQGVYILKLEGNAESFVTKVVK